VSSKIDLPSPVSAGPWSWVGSDGEEDVSFPPQPLRSFIFIPLTSVVQEAPAPTLSGLQGRASPGLVTNSEYGGLNAVIAAESGQLLE
jgi:hypothetical protein